jgi:hypothetical protein
MTAKLHIYLRSRRGRTESLYAVSAGSTIVFHNSDCDEPLKVVVWKIGPKGAPESRKGKRIKVAAGKKREFRIRRSTPPEAMYKYSAQIGRSEVEDPIIYVPGRTKK